MEGINTLTMLSFSQFLSEARMAPLYHSTKPETIKEILKNGFYPKTVQNSKKLMMSGSRQSKMGYVNGISLTRSERFARRWQGLALWLELDQERLAQKYRIVPLQYWQEFKYDPDTDGGGSKHSVYSKTRHAGDKHADNEYEEFLISEKPIPPTYITKIHYVANRFTDQDEMIQEFKDIIQSKGLKIEFVEHGPIKRSYKP